MHAANRHFSGFSPITRCWAVLPLRPLWHSEVASHSRPAWSRTMAPLQCEFLYLEQVNEMKWMKGDTLTTRAPPIIGTIKLFCTTYWHVIKNTYQINHLKLINDPLMTTLLLWVFDCRTLTSTTTSIPTANEDKNHQPGGLLLRLNVFKWLRFQGLSVQWCSTKEWSNVFLCF